VPTPRTRDAASGIQALSRGATADVSIVEVRRLQPSDRWKPPYATRVPDTPAPERSERRRLPLRTAATSAGAARTLPETPSVPASAAENALTPQKQVAELKKKLAASEAQRTKLQAAAALRVERGDARDARCMIVKEMAYGRGKKRNYVGGTLAPRDELATKWNYPLNNAHKLNRNSQARIEKRRRLAFELRFESQAARDVYARTHEMGCDGTLCKSSTPD